MSNMFTPACYNISRNCNQSRLIDVEHWSKESHQWELMTTVNSIPMAEQRIDDAIRDARREGNFAISPADFRAVSAR